MSNRNPYIVGSPILEPANFYGRTALISEILEAKTPQYCVLGVRRIGKTSLLHQIEHKYTVENRKIAIYLNLQSIKSAEDMGWQLQRRIMSLSSTHSLINAFITHQEKRHLNEVMINWIDFCNLHKINSLLLIDEAEELEQLSVEDLGQFRALFERDSSASIVITGSRYLRKLVINEKTPIPLLDTLAIRMLSIFEEEDATNLISQNNRVKVEENTHAEIRNYSGLHPFFIQFIAYKLFQNGGLNNIELNSKVWTLSADLFMILSNEYSRLTEPETLIMRELAFARPTNLEDLKEKLKFQDHMLHLSLLELEDLGFIRSSRDQYFLGNVFWQKYLELDL